MDSKRILSSSSEVFVDGWPEYVPNVPQYDVESKNTIDVDDLQISGLSTDTTLPNVTEILDCLDLLVLGEFKLNVLLYYCQGIWLSVFETRLFSDDIHREDGPVIKVIKRLVENRVKILSSSESKVTLTETQTKLIQSVIPHVKAIGKHELSILMAEEYPLNSVPRSERCVAKFFGTVVPEEVMRMQFDQEHIFPEVKRQLRLDGVPKKTTNLPTMKTCRGSGDAESSIASASLSRTSGTSSISSVIYDHRATRGTSAGDVKSQKSAVEASFDDSQTGSNDSEGSWFSKSSSSDTSTDTTSRWSKEGRRETKNEFSLQGRLTAENIAQYIHHFWPQIVDLDLLDIALYYCNGVQIVIHYQQLFDNSVLVKCLRGVECRQPCRADKRVRLLKNADDEGKQELLIGMVAKHLLTVPQARHWRHVVSLHVPVREALVGEELDMGEMCRTFSQMAITGIIGAKMKMHAIDRDLDSLPSLKQMRNLLGQGEEDDDTSGESSESELSEKEKEKKRKKQEADDEKKWRHEQKEEAEERKKPLRAYLERMEHKLAAEMPCFALQEVPVV